ncbi:MAG: pyridoxamine 5'-phosphate oxidase family protein [Rhodocyclaceae bacterium]|nr:pyridoxamine 5'-phosphate oxidase family protein [Rhodocyclaceae bacterium]
MALFFDAISDRHRAFIEAQKMFFVATATAEGRINLSPKGMDALRVLGPNRVAWLNLTGSGNESAAHVQVDPRMTVMLCAFEGSPMIVRLYGRARAVHRTDADWPALSALFGERQGARQVFDLEVDSVQTSCGFAVPFFDYQGERDLLVQWADKKGDEGIRAYWAEKNQTSIDGLPTGIVEKNG